MLYVNRIFGAGLALLILLPFGLAAATITGSGTISGTFENPTPACQAAPGVPDTTITQCAGVGTGTITWSYPLGTLPGQLSFTGGTFAGVAKGQEFVAGLLYYFNGSTASGTSINSATLQLISTSPEAQFNQTLVEPIRIHGTINYGVSPEQDADYIYFPNHPEMGSFRVFENASATVEIRAKFGSLDLVGFGDVVLDPEHPDSNPSAGFVNGGISEIPEPSTWLLALAGLAICPFLRRRVSR